MRQFDYARDKRRDRVATLGLVVLQVDETIESEFRTLIPDDRTVLHHTRVPSAEHVTPDLLRMMEGHIAHAVQLLPPRTLFDVIGYACTSGATMIGPERVATLVNSVHKEARVTDPLTAVKAWLTNRKARRIGLLTPYVPEVTTALVDALGEVDISVTTSGSFFESDEYAVARIAADDIFYAIENVAASGSCDAIFVSCTNLPTQKILALAARRIGKPVISSNAALAWHMLKLAEGRPGMP
ncbi:MAG: aspartate/glutamate racemase family protein [Rhodobiaceae bacterium]|nr:aspartate/glutamate racemase family protein [Rhodobiaceae bacterium]